MKISGERQSNAVLYIFMNFVELNIKRKQNNCTTRRLYTFNFFISVIPIYLYFKF